MRQTGMYTNAISQPQLVYHRRSWTDGSKQKHVPETSISESDVKTVVSCSLPISETISPIMVTAEKPVFWEGL